MPDLEKRAKIKGWRDVINTDFPTPSEITEDMARTSSQMAQRGYRADMRIATGRIYTTSDYEKRRQKILNTPLP